jgi:hypothetical protein
MSGMSKKAWQEEKTRITERFFEAKKHFTKIEARKTLASSEENLTEEELIARSKKAENERREELKARKEKLQAEAKKNNSCVTS